MDRAAFTQQLIAAIGELNAKQDSLPAAALAANAYGKLQFDFPVG